MAKSLYRKLCTETKEIRLVRVLPGNSMDEIFCELLTDSLDRFPVYEAVSYVWGDKEVTAPIYVNEIPFHVTTNLKSAIEGLRSSTAAKIFWIDAISIDQDNTQERNEQVLLMRKIYSQALNVLLWFGPQSDESDKVTELLPLFTISHHYYELSFATHSSDGSLLDDNELSNILRPLEIIIQNPWWDRIWVVQEVALARRALICYGQRTCEWNHLAGAINWVGKHGLCCGFQFARYAQAFDILNRFSSRMYRQFELCQEVYKSKHLTFPWFLNHLRFLQATDLHDKVYGTLGLTHILQFDADYKLSIEATYEHTTRFIISQYQSLEVLNQATLSQKKLNLPSWVPDWSYYDGSLTGPKLGADIGKLQAMFSACKDRRATMALDNRSGQISLQGIYFDSISRVSPIVVSELTPMLPYAENYHSFYLEVLQYYREILAGIDKAAEDLHNHMWRTLFLDVVPDDDPKIYRRMMPKDYETYANLQEWLNGSRSVTESNFASFISIQSSHINQRIFSTKDHRIGIGPRETQEGDLICVLDGGPLPFILRKDTSATNINQYTLVGTAYVHGVMDGEIVDELARGKGTLQEFCLR